LAEYLGDNVSTKEVSVVYEDVSPGSSGLMAQKLKEALQKKEGKK
jgi:hypothetical protein